MRLKDWLAKKAGPSEYGDAFARQAVKDGIVLGRVLYLSHGSRASGSGVLVLEDEEQMRTAGFSLYCIDPLNRPAMEDWSALSKQTRAVGLAFALKCATNAACNFMKQSNAAVFCRSMGHSSETAISQLGVPPTIDDILHYLRLPAPSGTDRILNLDEPGKHDYLACFLEEAGKRSGNGAIAFQRRGVTGFDLVAIPLASETVKAIRVATQQFGW
jgi:hypothetical protein